MIIEGFCTIWGVQRERTTGPSFKVLVVSHWADCRPKCRCCRPAPPAAPRPPSPPPSKFQPNTKCELRREETGERRPSRIRATGRMRTTDGVVALSGVCSPCLPVCLPACQPASHLPIGSRSIKQPLFEHVKFMIGRVNGKLFTPVFLVHHIRKKENTLFVGFWFYIANLIFCFQESPYFFGIGAPGCCRTYESRGANVQHKCTTQIKSLSSD